MRIHLATSILGAVFAANALAGIDFTPTGGERVLEGIHFKQILFHQGGREIAYEAPRGWSYSGDAAQFRLTPPGVSQAQASIEQAALPAPQPMDDAIVKQLQQATLAAVPSGAQNVALVSEEKNPMRIDKQETYEAVVGYNFFGQDYQLSVLYANLPDTQDQQP